MTLSKVRRELALVPVVVHSIEVFEITCGKLSKASGCQVIKGAMRRTQNRDFKMAALTNTAPEKAPAAKRPKPSGKVVKKVAKKRTMSPTI